MKSAQIISRIDEIYERFMIPPNLKEHMLRVAGVAGVILHNWKGHELNREDIIAVCLIHDLGNIVKMDFSSEIGIKMLGKEANRVEYWKSVRQDIIKKYGEDEYQASRNMAKELKVSERVLFLLELNKVRVDKERLVSDDWEAKICSYADLRVSPFGVVSLVERFDDLKKRYAKLNKDEAGRTFFDRFKAAGLEMEKQILEKTTILAEDINDERIIKKV
jgi:5'-deoxynucleotidase YfbR-like HD superfamily hydrolase